VCELLQQEVEKRLPRHQRKIRSTCIRGPSLTLRQGVEAPKRSSYGCWRLPAWQNVTIDILVIYRPVSSRLYRRFHSLGNFFPIRFAQQPGNFFRYRRRQLLPAVPPGGVSSGMFPSRRAAIGPGAGRNRVVPAGRLPRSLQLAAAANACHWLGGGFLSDACSARPIRLFHLIAKSRPTDTRGLSGSRCAWPVG
jgi:hypothetical protein